MNKKLWLLLLSVLLIAQEGYAGDGIKGISPIRGTGKGQGALWVVSIGINEYVTTQPLQVMNSISDAKKFSDFSISQYMKWMAWDTAGKVKKVHSYLLTGNNATRKNIMEALQKIVDSSKPNDYFLFNFAGFCMQYTIQGEKQTIFAPFGMTSTDSSYLIKEGISLKVLSQFITLIPANNQFFFTEAGPSEGFRTEFIRAVVEKNPIAASLSMKNRVVMVTNRLGLDNLVCNKVRVEQGPMNYYLTNIPENQNMFELFADKRVADKLVYSIRKNEVICGDYQSPYFDIYFERDFLEPMKDMVLQEETMRGGRVSNAKVEVLPEKKPGEKVAIIIATNEFASAEDWPYLNNPLNDAQAVGDTLTNQYGYKVKYVINKKKEEITNSLVTLSKDLKEDDQLIIFFAGHGDYNDELLDDGFIVCKDSKPIAADPTRESYLSFNRMSMIFNKLPSRQVMVLLDVCFGGTFGDKVVKTMQPDKEVKVNPNEPFVSKKLRLRTRRFISSGGKNTVPDKDLAPQFRNHSPFAVLLLEALRTKGVNNYLTSSQIYAMLQDKLPSGPLLGDFGDVQRGSEFVLVGK